MPTRSSRKSALQRQRLRERFARRTPRDSSSIQHQAREGFHVISLPGFGRGRAVGDVAADPEASTGPGADDAACRAQAELILRVYGAVADYSYEVSGRTEPDGSGAVLVSSVAEQLWRTAGSKATWLHLEPLTILREQRQYLDEPALASLFLDLYTFILWLHHNEGLPADLTLALHAELESNAPPQFVDLRAQFQVKRRACDIESCLRAQRARHEELVARHTAN